MSTTQGVCHGLRSFVGHDEKEHLNKNVVITGVPNDDLVFEGITYTTTKEKIAAVLQKVDIMITDNSYELISFPSAEGRTTHTCKLVFDNLQKKDSVIKNSKLLKDYDELKYIFIKWDEPPLTRKENYGLRCKKRDLQEPHPTDKDNIKILKGILYHNSIQCITNQLF